MSLREDLISTVDGARSVLDNLDLRRHTVVIRTRTWSGSQVGQGTPTDADFAPAPTPRVKQLAPRLIASSGGIYQEGDQVVDKITATLEESDLNPHLSANQELIWVLDGEDWRPVGRPDKRNFEWKIVLRRRQRPRA